MRSRSTTDYATLNDRHQGSQTQVVDGFLGLPFSLLLAVAFALYGLVAVALFATEMPPFQNPDEPAHLLRAGQIAKGGLLGEHVYLRQADGSILRTTGGIADGALLEAAHPFGGLMGHPESRAAQSMWSPNVHWSRNKVAAQFNNTVLYPPILYLPAALAVGIGRSAGLTVVQTLTLSRLLAGVASIAIGATAIAASEAASVWLFAILTLPMSLAVTASPGQDAMLHACSALGGALLFRSLRLRLQRPIGVLVALTAVVSLICTARPPYIGLALLPLSISAMQLKWRILSSATIVLITGTWSSIAIVTGYSPFAIVHADAGTQLLFLMHNPLAIVSIARETLQSYRAGYIETFVGNLGWLDTPLPPAYHAVAWKVLAAAALATMLDPRGNRVSGQAQLLIGLGVLISAAAVFGTLYLTWTPPGAARVEGVQGRYFLPLAMIAGLALPTLRTRHLAWLRSVITLAVVSFPIITLSVVMRAIVLRYYLH